MMSRTGTWRDTAFRLAVIGVLLAALVGLPFGTTTSGAGVVAATAGEPGGGGSDPAGSDEVLPPGGSWTVTLLTGEVVDVSSDAEGQPSAQVTEHDGPYRSVRRADGSLYVIPLAVTPLLDDVLDIELFNVTGLIQQGYDDESRDSIGLIVRREPGTDLRVFGSPESQALPSIDAVALDVPKESTEGVGDEVSPLDASGDVLEGVTQVWLDRQMTGTWATEPTAAPLEAASPAQAPELDPNLTQIGADVAWDEGLTGDGVSVAVLDTGIDHDHPDVAGKVTAEENFTAEDDTVDRNGHGTHVAATAAGSGAGSAGARSGVAPDADLVIGKVLDEWGGGWESEVIAGMEWAAPQAEVVNMSIGGPSSGSDDPLALAVEQLTEEHDSLFVVAAGNSGPISGSVDTPGSAGRALTVGAVDFDDGLAEFSSRGPTVESYLLKPEVLAPGVDIVAARATEGWIGDPVDEHYATMSGTSMATPHTAGAAAVLAQEHPDWGADELKSGLVGSSEPIEGDGYDVGAGRLDVGAAITGSLRADPGVVSTVLPDPRSEPHKETVAWTNHGDEPLTVSFDADLQDRSGNSVDGVEVEPAELSLAPDEMGEATVSIDGPGLDRGLYSGVISARPDGATDEPDVRLPLGVYAAPEMVDLTIEATAPGTSPDQSEAQAFYAIVNLDDAGEFLAGGELMLGGFEGDSGTVSVPAGRYSVTGDVSTGDFTTEVVAQVGDPDVSIAEATSVAFDGASAEPLNPTVEDVETAPPMYSGARLVTMPEKGTAGYGLVTTELYSWYPMPPVHVTPMEADPEVFAANQIFRLQAPHLTAEIGGEPLDITGVHRDHDPAVGEHSLKAVDVGDGSDLSAASGELAVARLPEDEGDRGLITERAADAEVALLAFIDETRSHVTLDSWGWADVPVMAAGGPAASDLIAAAGGGEDVTVMAAASPYAYDIASPEDNQVEPDRVIDRAEQDGLATLDERFHRDADGPAPTADRRYHQETLMNLDSEGPLPEQRVAYVTPGVDWLSITFGRYDDWGDTLLTADAGVTYEPGEEYTLDWLTRPQWPAPVGGDSGGSGCQPTPVTRVGDRLDVWLTPLQDGLDRYTCAEPQTAGLTLERDGELVDRVEDYAAQFEVPAERGTYTLSYEQEAEAPYAHRSETTWTFDSETPADGDTEALLPLLVVDYDLPLDTLNRLTGDTASLAIQQMTGAEQHRVLPPKVSTSSDGGESWQPARVRPRRGNFEVTLPDVAEGGAVSLQVNARDVRGNRIEQTLYDAYFGDGQAR